MTAVERRTRQEATVPDTINGLPLHPLVVHAVVVLLPLACLGIIAIALRVSWRARYGGLVLTVAAVATALVPVAAKSGENLEHTVGDPGQHAQLGDNLIWFALPLPVVAAALVVLHRLAARAGAPAVLRGRSPLMLAVGALAVVVAAANLVQVYRVGDSGARAVWQPSNQGTPVQER
jgi:uncharacterized membrane protein